MKFLCDHMLGTLVKWLRFLGNDVEYPGPIDDNELMEMAIANGRTLLTRDRALSVRAAGSIYVASDDLDAQILQVLQRFDLPHDLAMTRCSVCNGALREVPKANVRGKVPEGVYERQAEFWGCDGCGHLYWRGSHWSSMDARLREIRAKAGAATP